MSFQFVQGVHLRRTGEAVSEIDALAERLGGRAGLDGLLADLPHRMRRWPVPALKARTGLRWRSRDTWDRRWWPQGITTSADASDTEDIGGRKVLAVSWYAKEKDGVGKGSRISFIDLERRRYRHVLLVVPTYGADGSLRLERLNVHAGGIVWAGPYLHVAATKKGLFTARLDDILRVPDHLRDADRDRIGCQEEVVSTYGYRYVLPVRFAYRSASDDGFEQVRYSFLSLDRSGGHPELVAGEYGRGGATTRLLSYPLDPETMHLVPGEDGLARPVLLEQGGVGNMQGAAVVRGTWYVTRSRGPWGLGSLYVGRPGQWRRHRWALPMGPEDISFWPSTDTLWSVSEWPGRRWVFSVPRSRVSGGGFETLAGARSSTAG